MSVRNMYSGRLSRREMLVGTGVSLAGIATTRLNAATFGHRGEGEPDWRSIRAGIALSPELIYLNAADLGPGLTEALTVQRAQARSEQQDPSFEARDRFVGMAEHARSLLARMLNASPDAVAITRNASDGNNIIAKGMELRAGDEVLLASDNHVSNIAPWQARARRDGIVVKVTRTPVEAASETEVTDSITRHITTRTRVISVSHITNTTGICYPIRALAQLARERKIWLHADGAQSFGWCMNDMRDLDCDSYCASMHKWAMGPIETGTLYVRPERLDEISPNVLSEDNWVEYGSVPHGARKFENVGQRDDSKLAGIERTLMLLADIGLPWIQRRVMQLAGLLRLRLAELPGVKVVGTGQVGISGPVVRALWRGRSPDTVAEELWRKRRVALTTVDGGVRFSPHIYNTEAELAETVELFAAALRR